VRLRSFISPNFADDFRGLVGASGLLVAGRVAGAAATLLFTIALARSMAPAEVGAVLTAIATAFLSSIFVTLYIESGSIRFLVAAKEAGRPELINGFIFAGRMTLACATPIVAGLFATANMLAGPEPSADRVLMIVSAAASIPAMGWLRLSGSHGTALGDVLKGSLPRTAVQPLLQLSFYLIYAAAAKETPGGAMLCVLGSYFSTAILQYALLRRTFTSERRAGRDASAWRDWIAHGLFLSPLTLLQEHLQHAIILAASFVLDEPHIAVLGVSLRFIAFIRFGVLAVNMAISPRISRAIARGDAIERDRQLRSAALVKAIPAAFASLLVILFATDILALFGDEYSHGANALAWLVLIPVGAAVFGPNYMLLNIAGERARIFRISLTGVVILFAATPLGALKAGVVGAAGAAALASLTWELFMYVSARRMIGVDASIAAALFAKR
jgi:O-antigen/teichoic acid export membrane protein